MTRIYLCDPCHPWLIHSLRRLVSLRLSAATRRLHSKRPCDRRLKSPLLSVSRPFNISLALPVEMAFCAATVNALKASERELACDPLTANFARSYGNL